MHSGMVCDGILIGGGAYCSKVRVGEFMQSFILKMMISACMLEPRATPNQE